MRFRSALVLAVTSTLTTSCVTQRLWDSTDPDARVSIPANRVSEAELRERGVAFRKDEFGNYQVGKSRCERFGDHAVRFAFTPAAVLLDVAPYAALAAAQGLLDDVAVKSGGSASGTLYFREWRVDRR